MTMEYIIIGRENDLIATIVLNATITGFIPLFDYGGFRVYFLSLSTIVNLVTPKGACLCHHYLTPFQSVNLPFLIAY